MNSEKVEFKLKIVKPASKQNSEITINIEMFQEIAKTGFELTFIQYVYNFFSACEYWTN
jgi:hypothetical protein